MPPRPVKTEPVRRSGNYRLGPHLAVQIPYDGVCACALAFSTLLSSQGADAHRLEPCNSIRGNPANLPASHKTVKAVSRFRFGCLLRVKQLNPTVVSRYRSLRTKGKRSAGGLMRPWPAGHPVSHRAVLKTREAWLPVSNRDSWPAGWAGRHTFHGFAPALQLPRIAATRANSAHNTRPPGSIPGRRQVFSAASTRAVDAGQGDAGVRPAAGAMGLARSRRPCACPAATRGTCRATDHRRPVSR